MESKNELNGIDEVLKENGIRDLITNDQLTSEDIFSDWVIATFLNDEDVADGRYAYHNYPDAPKPDATETIYECPTEFLTRDVHQFGVDYIRINCDGEFTLRFEGSSLVDVTPFYPHSGDYFFWSNKGDEGNMTLTKEFDFTSHAGPLSMSYYTWYDLEKDYDYIYLEVSEDGETWQIIETPSGTDADPSGNSYGWGYNGTSNSWIKESIDLTKWAGKEVFIRFEYVTDAAVHGEGMVLDDISIPEIGYSTDFENGDDGWHGDGWVRMNNIIPQTYRLSLIVFGENTEVIPIHVQEDLSAEANIVIGGDVDSAVLVVSGISRYSRQKAAYRITIQ
jgi:immune inhibitor A